MPCLSQGCSIKNQREQGGAGSTHFTSAGTSHVTSCYPSHTPVRQVTYLLLQKRSPARRGFWPRSQSWSILCPHQQRWGRLRPCISSKGLLAWQKGSLIKDIFVLALAHCPAKIIAIFCFYKVMRLHTQKNPLQGLNTTSVTATDIISVSNASRRLKAHATSPRDWRCQGLAPQSLLSSLRTITFHRTLSSPGCSCKNIFLPNAQI